MGDPRRTRLTKKRTLKKEQEHPTSGGNVEKKKQHTLCIFIIFSGWIAFVLFSLLVAIWQSSLAIFSQSSFVTILQSSFVQGFCENNKRDLLQQ